MNLVLNEQQDGLYDLAVERDLLVEMALEAARQNGVDSTDWLQLAESTEAMVMNDGLKTERNLESVAHHVRMLLLRRGHRIEEQFQRSPDLSQSRVLPSGDRLRHGYERNLSPTAIETKLKTHCATLPDGWHRGTLAFSSGMASLMHVVQTLEYLLNPTAWRPVRLDFWGDYFESNIMLEYMSGPGFTFRKLDEKIVPTDSTEAVDVLLIEPVRYNWTLDVLDISRMIHKWRSSSHRASVIVLDTTLSSTLWPTEEFLAALTSPAGAPLVIEVRSGLKLDQQGLEIANLGIVDIFQHERSLNTALSLEVVEKSLRLARSTAGVSPSTASVAALDAPFLLDERWTRRHAGRLFQHNARLAAKLARYTGGLFDMVAHPSIGRSGHGPFVVVGLRQDRLENHGLLLAVIRHEVMRRGLTAVYGSSFGFRTSRFETVIPRVSEGNGLFKVAVGSRGGPSVSGLEELLIELARYPSMEALRDAYDVEPVVLS